MEHHFDIIERYFSGTMSPDERIQFENLRSADQELDREVVLYSRANEMIRAGAGNRMKHHLDELGQQEMANTMVESYLRFRLAKKHWYATAAIILLLFGTGLLAYQLFMAKTTSLTLSQVYDRYYEMPSADLVITRGQQSDEATESLWTSAIRLYSDKKFEAAIRDFSILLQDPGFSHRSAASFYMGISYLNLNEPDSALVNFNEVAPASSLYQDAGWYTGLSYLKAGNKSGAVDVFDKISKAPRHFKKKQAREILRQLSKTRHK